MTIRHHNGETRIECHSLRDAFASLPEDRIVITDQNVHRHYFGLTGNVAVVVPAGESSKSLAVYAQVVDQCLRRRPSRKTTIVAFGGGVIGDLAGFVAATLLRGLPLVQIPTSLLAMVDSSVGGKVGVDTPVGKNLVGAFKPATQVHVCLDALETLPDRELTNGTAEVLKYAFIGNQPTLEELDEWLSHRNYQEIVMSCIRHKARVVEADEFETNGIRATLNFGHTVGHAIEKLLNYETFLHGEAISIGMVAETRLAERLGVCAVGTAESVRQRLKAQNLPVYWPGLQNVEPLLEAMRSDKKVTDGRLAFSLLTRLGECKLVTNVEEASVVAALLE